MKEKTEKIKISQAIVVEGKYDKAKLSSLIEGVIITTNGFRIYKDKEKVQLLRKLAAKQGAIVITDSDSAGFRIRGHLRSILQGVRITHVYIPQISGKEKRKQQAGKEGLLGVEGIEADKLRELILGGVRQANAEGGPTSQTDTDKEIKKAITKQDFFEDGLTGCENSAIKRQLVLKKLELPSYVTANALLEVMNSLLTYEEYKTLVRQCDPSAELVKMT